VLPPVRKRWCNWSDARARMSRVPWATSYQNLLTLNRISPLFSTPMRLGRQWCSQPASQPCRPPERLALSRTSRRDYAHLTPAGHHQGSVGERQDLLVVEMMASTAMQRPAVRGSPCRELVNQRQRSAPSSSQTAGCDPVRPSSPRTSPGRRCGSWPGRRSHPRHSAPRRSSCRR
jgi:hypothetical protein